MFIKPTLNGKFTFKYLPDIKNPNVPHKAIRKPIAAAEPIALFIENPECFKTGTFIIAPPIPINEDTKPETKPNIIFEIIVNFFFNFSFFLYEKNIKRKKVQNNAKKQYQ